MEKNNGKIIAIVALFVAVVALSIGFAAFTDTLTINGTATVQKGADAFDGSFKYDADSEETCTLAGGGAITGTYNARTSSDDSWSGITVPIGTTSGTNSVVCTATVKNTSNFDAYLKTITITGPLTYTTGTGDDAASNVDAVCDHVTATVQVGSTPSNSLAITTSSTSSSAATNLNQKVDKNTGSVDVTVTITYDYTTGPVPDGDVTVTLPTISHNYSTVNPGAGSSS